MNQEVNKTKRKCMDDEHRLGEQEPSHFGAGSYSFKKVNEFVYFGCLSWSPIKLEYSDITRLIEQLQKHLNEQAICHHHLIICQTTKVKINTILRPVVTYLAVTVYCD